jgi:diguanylate cyclase (GGDEF)-like protein
MAKQSDGKNIGIRGSNRDISELKTLQEKLKHVAGHDHLTGLANRFLFLEHLQQSIKEAQRNNSMFIVAFIDLDGFKEINDQYGHDVGDHVLKRVANDLRGVIRKNDIVARFGGDEFVGIFQISSKDDVSTLKGKILKKISNEIECYLYQITIRLSVGMSVYPTDSRDIDTLLKIADDSMYAMKQKNKANRK